MADIHGSPGDPGLQMPQASSPGPAAVPYAGADQSPQPPDYGVPEAVFADVGAAVMSGVTGLGTTESPAAHDIAAGTVDAPYYPGDISPINAMGDNDAGGNDDVAGTVAGAVAAADARWHEFQSDTFGIGSTYGDIVTLPPSPLDPGVGSLGTTDPEGHFYDPPRDYGGQTQ